jgi:transposase InsO family protein
VWVADITYIAITVGFVYRAAILDAWSRRVAGYAISRSIDARLALARSKPPSGRAIHPKVAYIIPTADRNTPRRSTANSSPITAFSGQ